MTAGRTETDFGPSTSAPARAPATWAPGTLIAERYRITRFLAQGGAGSVYAAEDTLLKSDVAIKFLRAEGEVSREGMERLRAEIAASRRVTHRNVCRVFDVGVHEQSLFLTMELFAGGTLAEELSRGAASMARARVIAEQLCAGLRAAHEAGIIHRDFKPHNVLCGSDRVVVTDFGIALALEKAHDTRDSSGTPAYMAPEQIAGGSATVQSDVYALGVVLYELVTGQCPFPSGSRAAVATAHAATLESPRKRTPALPTSWERTILACLAREPAKRPSSVDAVWRALDDQARARRRRTVAAGAALTVIALAAASWTAFREWSEARANAPRVRRSVAILDIGPPASLDESWMAGALIDALNTELGADQRLRVVARERVDDARRDLNVADWEAADTLQRLRSYLDVDLVVAGKLDTGGADRDHQAHVQLAIKDAQSGETVAWVRERAPAADLAGLAESAARDLREELGLPPLGAAERARVRSTMPSSATALRNYVEGRAALMRMDPLLARTHLERAIEADPNFALAYFELARALEGLGEDGAALERAKKAMALSEGLGREERLKIEAHHHQIAKDWQSAVATYRALFTFFPDNIDYGIQLAQAEMKGGSPDDARKTVATMRALPAVVSDDPRIDYEEARAAHGLSDYPKSLEIATRTVRKAEARGNQSVVSRAGYFQGIALVNLGRGEEGRRVLERSRDIADKRGDRYTSGIIRPALAGAYMAIGEMELARAELERAESDLLAIGNAYFAASARESLGKLDLESGALERAKTRIESAIVEYEREGSKHALSTAFSALARLRIAEGALDDAKRQADKALEVSRAIKRPLAEADARLVLASIARSSGEHSEELEHVKVALGLARDAKNEARQARATALLGDLARRNGDRTTAHTALDEAARMQERLNDLSGLEETHLLQGWLALTDQDFDRARALAHAAAENFDRAGLARPRARALELAVRTALARGDGRAAKTELAKMRHVADSTGDVGLELVTAGLEAEAATPHQPAKRRAVARRARSLGFEEIAREMENGGRPEKGRKSAALSASSG